MSLIQVSQISGPQETYIIVNFKACKINRDIYKLTRTSTLILKKKTNKAHKLSQP
jgi:hypothetical protein